MRIAFVYDAVYPWEKGGAQKRIWEMARRLADRHDVHLFGMHYWDGPPVIEREGVTLHGVCDPPELYVEGRRSITEALYFAAHATPPLFREEFDVVDCQEFPHFPVFPSKLHELVGKSTLFVTWYEVWDSYWYDYLGWKGVFGKLVERLTVRLPNRMIAISDYIKEDLRTIGRDDNVWVVPNGVDYYGLQEIPTADADWDVIYVGRLSEHKNVDVLLEAVATVSDHVDGEIRCGVIGDGPERDALESHTADLGVGDQIEFLGFIEDDEEVIANLKAADVFVLPSTREGFPNTILEANACGVPSIVVDHPENGATAVVEDGETGYITSVSAEAIADKITTILTDTEERESLSEGARAFGERHDWSVIVEQVEQLYSQAVD